MKNAFLRTFGATERHVMQGDHYLYTSIITDDLEMWFWVILMYTEPYIGKNLLPQSYKQSTIIMS